MENVFWDIEFNGTAEANGTLIIGITFGIDLNPPGTRGQSVFVPVRKGTSPDDKAQLAINALRQAFGADFFEFQFSPPDDDFKFKVRSPGPNERFIHSVTVTDRGTGEDFDAVKDDPGEEVMLTTAFFSVEGKGIDRDGVARLRLGDEHPLVEVATFGKPGKQILHELQNAFNKAYAKTGYCAEELPRVPGIGIKKVPCPLGIRAGSTDPGLITARGLLGPELDVELQ